MQNGIVDASFAGTGDNISWKPKPDNLPASGYYGQRVYDVKFDRSGNLWVLVSNANKPDKSGPQLVMLPAVKVSAPVSAISKADWVTARSNGSLLIPADFNCDVEGKLVMLPASNTIAVLGKYTADNLYLYRHSSNPADVNSSGASPSTPSMTRTATPYPSSLSPRPPRIPADSSSWPPSTASSPSPILTPSTPTRIACAVSR